MSSGKLVVWAHGSSFVILRIQSFVPAFAHFDVPPASLRHSPARNNGLFEGKQWVQGWMHHGFTA